MTKDKEKQKSFAEKFLCGLIGADLSPSTVHKNKKLYNKKYKLEATAYGFKSFVELYDFCQGNDDLSGLTERYNKANLIAKAAGGAGKSKEKDTSDLVLATKQGMRNGKPYTSRYWTDPNKAKKTGDSTDTDSVDNNGIPPATYFGGDKFGKPFKTTTANSKAPDSWLTVGKYKKKCFDYVFTIENDCITFMAGLSNTDGIIGLQFVSAPDSRKLIGNYYMLFSRVLQEAWLNNYGVQFDPAMFDKYLNTRPFCEAYQLKNKKDKYILKPKELQDKLGDSSCFHVSL